MRDDVYGLRNGGYNLVYSVVNNQFYGWISDRICDVDDLISAGLVGIAEANRDYVHQKDALSFKTFAWHCAKNRITDYLRADYNTRLYEVENIGNRADYREDSDPAIIAEKRDMEEKVRSYIRRLPVMQRTYINESFYNGLKDREIMNKFGVGKNKMVAIKKNALGLMWAALMRSN